MSIDKERLEHPTKQDQHIDLAIQMEGLLDTLLEMHKKGQVDLKEVNSHFREAVGKLSFMTVDSLSRDLDQPVEWVMRRAERFTKSEFEVFHFPGVDNG